MSLIHHIFKPRNYLEIGVQYGKSLRLAKCVAYGVDPDPKINFDLGPLAKVFNKTSDEFFKSELNLPSFDLSFIDGMHLFEFALRDFINVEKRSSKGGVTVVDDIFPSHPLQGSRERKTRHWAGDIWRLYRLLQAVRKDLYFFPIDARPTGLLLISNLDPSSEYTYEDYLEVEAEINKGPKAVPETIINRVDILPLSFEQIRRNLLNISMRLPSVSLRGALPKAFSPNNSEVPIFIINRNRLTSLLDLINWLGQRGYKNINIIDNNSSYEPLLEFYKSSGVNVIKLGNNIGPRRSASLDEVKSTKVPYIITDSDVIPSAFCPDDVIEHMFEVLEDQPEILKVGPSLRIDDLPDFYEEKAKVVQWESQFWRDTKEESPSSFIAPIDTTFALYRPGYLFDHESNACVRLGFPYCFSHSPWYVDY